MRPRGCGARLGAPLLYLVAACAHAPPPPPAAPPPDPATVAGARQTLEQALGSRKPDTVNRLFDPALVKLRSWSERIVPRAVDPIAVKLDPASVSGDEVVARLQLSAARVRGAAGPASWQSTLVVVPDTETGWKFRQAPPATIEKLRLERWKRDIAFVKQELPRLHVAAFAEVRRRQFEGALAALESALPRLDDHQVEVGLMSAVALLGDTHTRLVTGYPSVGVELQWFADGIFAIRAARPNGQLARLKLLRVGTVPVEQAVARVQAVFAADNEARVLYLAPWYLTQPAVLHAVGLAAGPDTAFYAFQRPDGREINLELSVPDVGQDHRWAAPARTTLRDRHPDSPFWFQRLARGRALYLKYDEGREPAGFQALTKKLLAMLDGGGVERLVIDLRDNEGGDSAVIEPLFTGLADRRGTPGFERLQILGLIGRRTFSAGMWNAIHLRKRLGAALIGEPTSGKPNSPGEVRTVALPASGLTLEYSTKHWLRDPDADLAALMPDVAVAAKSADHFAGRDVVLDAALGFNRRAAPTLAGR